MKNVLKIVGKILKSIVLGSSDILPSFKDNVESDNNGKGNYDFVRLGTYLVQLALIIAFITGKLNLEQLKDLLNNF